MKYVKLIKDLTFEEEVDVLHLLLQDVEGVTRGKVLDILSVVYFEDVRTYMENIGILISYNDEDVRLHINTVGDDQQWSKLKIKMLFDHLYNKVSGGY